MLEQLSGANGMILVTHAEPSKNFQLPIREKVLVPINRLPNSILQQQRSLSASPPQTNCDRGSATWCSRTPAHNLDPVSSPGAHQPRSPSLSTIAMASDEEVKIKSKKDKKEKKEKKSSTDGVHKKKDKKDKKADKEKLKQKVADSLDRQLQADAAASSKADADADADDHPGSDVDDIKNPEVQTQLVYFAVPLADVKGHKKIYKTIKKGMSGVPYVCAEKTRGGAFLHTRTVY